MLRIALITLGDPFTATGGYLYHRRMAQLAPRFDAQLLFLAFARRPFVASWLAGPRLLQRARLMGVQVVVIDSICAARLAPSLATDGLDIPLVAMLHQPPGGIESHGWPRKARARLDDFTYGRTCKLMVASESLRDELQRTGHASERLVVIPPGRDVAALPESPIEDLREGRLCAFLCVANWLPHKGLIELLEAFLALPEGLGTLHLVGEESGDRRYQKEIESMLAEAGPGRVIRHGQVDTSRVAALYRDADVFVLPSWKETYGTVWGEAMAAGLPVIGWRLANLPYLLDDGREGLLVDPGHVHGLAEAMRRLAEDEDLRRRLGQAAAERAASRPTWQDSAGTFFRTLRDVAAQGR